MLKYPAPIEFLHLANVNLQTLRHVCTDAGLTVDPGLDNDLLVTMGRLAVFVSILPSGIVKLRAPFEMDNGLIPEDLLAKANAFNQRSTLGKMHVETHEEFGHRVEVNINLELVSGLHPTNLVSCLKRLQADVDAAGEWLRNGGSA